MDRSGLGLDSHIFLRDEMDPVLLRLSSMVSDSVLVMLSRFSSIVFTEKSGFEVVSDVLLMAEDSLVGLHLDPDTFLSLALKSKGSAFTVFAFADASSSAADGNIFEVSLCTPRYRS